MVRFDTYNASAHFVRQLEQSGNVDVVHDGADNLLVQLITGELISVYLIETVIPPYEIKLTLADNHMAGIHTLFILWGEMFLPENGTIFTPDEWMLVLSDLYENKVYAFGVYGKDIHIFPVYFERSGLEWRVRYGEDVNVAQLGTKTSTIHQFDELRGVWRIADFTHQTVHEYARQHRKQHAHSVPASAKRSPWELLGVTQQTDLETIKKNYRRLARLYHPDINRSLNATEQMQVLNEAYDAILRIIEEHEQK